MGLPMGISLATLRICSASAFQSPLLQLVRLLVSEVTHVEIMAEASTCAGKACRCGFEDILSSASHTTVSFYIEACPLVKPWFLLSPLPTDSQALPIPSTNKLFLCIKGTGRRFRELDTNTK